MAWLIYGPDATQNLTANECVNKETGVEHA